MKQITLEKRTEVLPALHGRAVQPVSRSEGAGARLTFAERTTRSRRFPLEQSLARIPEPSRLGRLLDIEV